uniref:Uncharacterized protein n=1 Tax=Romanomermis culicivorax TaxID=13658 RepID=A0A915KNL6_ROMCU
PSTIVTFIENFNKWAVAGKDHSNNNICFNQYQCWSQRPKATIIFDPPSMIAGGIVLGGETTSLFCKSEDYPEEAVLLKRKMSIEKPYILTFLRCHLKFLQCILKKCCAHCW